MTFTVDHNKANPDGFIPEAGIYEVVIDEAKESYTQRGKEFLKLTLLIRDDVEQAGQGEQFSWPIWKLRDPKDTDPAGFPQWRIQAISKAVGLTNGQSYESLDDWLKAIRHKPLRVGVEQESFNDRLQARVTTLYETQHPKVTLKQQGFIEVDEDMPF